MSKLFSKLVFSIDFIIGHLQVCVDFFLQKYCLSQGIMILKLKLERAINVVTRETSLSSADSYTAWSGTGNYHTFTSSA